MISHLVVARVVILSVVKIGVIIVIIMIVVGMVEIVVIIVGFLGVALAEVDSIMGWKCQKAPKATILQAQ